MQQIEYTFRPYQDGDSDRINDLYFRITGRLRTREKYVWQWLSAPVGPGDIWLIEAHHPGGEVELIGHHGIMPFRFTQGDLDLVFGKTENTMVLPEYRRKILYPRYERLFAAQYESRYHALFSTMGPAPALRQRKAQGYSFKSTWFQLEHSLSSFGNLIQILHRNLLSNVVAREICKLSRVRAQSTINEVEILSSSEARESPFFNSYWGQARHNWGIAPRRDRQDLEWRFWNNPYGEFATVTFSQKGEQIGFAVLQLSRLPVIFLADLSIIKPEKDILTSVLSDLFYIASREFRAGLIKFACTSDSFPQDLIKVLRGSFRMTALLKYHSRTKLPAPMPRKITQKGEELHLQDIGWAITPIITEGRA